jgi:hypothetical protein
LRVSTAPSHQTLVSKLDVLRSIFLALIGLLNDRFWRKAAVRTDTHVSEGPQPDSSTRQVRTFRDLFLITELLDSKAESDDVGF